MKSIQPLKMLMMTAAIVFPLILTTSAPLFAAKPVKVPDCKVLSASYPTIQSAVNDANCSSIDVPKGTFYENVTVIGRDVTIQGAGPGRTIVNGGQVSAVFAIYGSGPQFPSIVVALSGMTITGGRAPGPRYNGGGIAATLAMITVTDSVITENEAANWGGGISNVTGTVTIEDSSITNNRAHDGGGIRVSNSANPDQTIGLTVTDSVIAGNVATRWGGGIAGSNAIDSAFPAKLTVKSSIINDNTAGTEGGGIYLFASTLTVKDSTIADNAPNDITP